MIIGKNIKIDMSEHELQTEALILKEIPGFKLLVRVQISSEIET